MRTRLVALALAAGLCASWSDAAMSAHNRGSRPARTAARKHAARAKPRAAKPALTKNPPLERARKLFAHGQYDKVLPWLKQALARSQRRRGNLPEQAEIYAMRGVVQVTAGRIALAIKDFVSAVDLNHECALPPTSPPKALELFQSVRSARPWNQERAPAGASAPSPKLASAAPALPPAPPPAPGALGERLPQRLAQPVSGPVANARAPATPPAAPAVAPTRTVAGPALAASSPKEHELLHPGPAPTPPAYQSFALDPSVLAVPLVGDAPAVTELEPWYRTWWFTTALSVAIAGGAGAGIWAYTRSQKVATVPSASLGTLGLQ
jgi:hypothetical protein